MNKHKGTRPLKEIRRFTTGDGVTLPDGRTGVIKAIGQTETSFEYMIDPSTGGDWVTIKQVDIQSNPAMNTGKYGGPSRGGAYGRGRSYGK